MSVLRQVASAFLGNGQSDDTTKIPPVKKWAAAFTSHRFICLQTYSGFRSSAADPSGENILLEPNCSDEELGAGLTKALAASRMLSLKESGAFFAVHAVTARYQEWVADLMQRYKLKTKKALFTGVNRCEFELQDGIISIAPTVHDRLEGWSRSKSTPLPTITITAAASARDIGAALREAFSHCR